MLRILINLLIKRLVRTGPDRSLTSPGILEMAKDRRPDCGCGPLRSCDFWSSPGLFPVLGLDFQTLLLTFLQPISKTSPTRQPDAVNLRIYTMHVWDVSLNHFEKLGQQGSLCQLVMVRFTEIIHSSYAFLETTLNKF